VGAVLKTATRRWARRTVPIKATVPVGSTAIAGKWVKKLHKFMTAGGRPRPQVVKRITELGLCQNPPKQ
jgi:hypothetical protein